MSRPTNQNQNQSANQSQNDTTVELVRCDPLGSPGELTAVRLVALLPDRWRCVPEVATAHRVRLRVRADVRPEAARGAVDAAARDSALHGWRLAS